VVRCRVPSSDAACKCSLDCCKFISGASSAIRNAVAPCSCASLFPCTRKKTGCKGRFTVYTTRYIYFRVPSVDLFYVVCKKWPHPVVVLTNRSINWSTLRCYFVLVGLDTRHRCLTAKNRRCLEVAVDNSICFVSNCEAFCRTIPEVCSGNIMAVGVDRWESSSCRTRSCKKVSRLLVLTEFHKMNCSIRQSHRNLRCCTCERTTLRVRLNPCAMGMFPRVKHCGGLARAARHPVNGGMPNM
jgi:hypothetical protein